MFSGIIESLGVLVDKQKDGTNIHFILESDLTPELKIDQSVAHNGVCLTVVSIDGNTYKVTAIEETLRLTNLSDLIIGDQVNFERCIRMSDRLDGHIVQGHVDGMAHVSQIRDKDGSWEFQFKLDDQFTDINGYSPDKLIIHKGSITINGVSLTITEVDNKHFGVAVIPYTYEHTNFNSLELGSKVNIELDVLGKYVARLTQ
ncbi:MAG: riboflavin synthase [Bacteroidia bacterium]|nr:riboflavin synthase [Bacteroidia bacterium]